MNATTRSIYWNGYRRMKRDAYEFGIERAYQRIYNSTASNTFVNGAKRAYDFLKRKGL